MIKDYPDLEGLTETREVLLAQQEKLVKEIEVANNANTGLMAQKSLLDDEIIGRAG